jgi:ABC-type transport system substrate-binding protein
MTHALNRKEILKKVFVGLGQITTGPFLPWSDNVDKSITPLTFDLAIAKQLLREAGWKDTDGDGLVDKVLNGKQTPFEFTMLLYGNKPEYTAMANIFKEDLIKIGVKMGVAPVEWSLMQKRMEEKNFDAYTGGWGVPWDSDPYQIWHSSQADLPKGSNRVGFRNKKADALIEKLRQTFDKAKRAEMYQALHRILHEEQPYTFFFYQDYVYCWREEVKNVTFAKDRPPDSYYPWWVAAE